LGKLRRRRWAGYIALMAETLNANKILFGNPEWRNLIGRQRHRWENYNRMGFK
jgi:hypothetical protein